MDKGHHYDLTKAEDREMTMRQIARTVELNKHIKDRRLADALFKAMSYYTESFSMRIYVHEMLFRQAVTLFGTAEQQDEWMDDINNWRVIGCFAMVRSSRLFSARDMHDQNHFPQIHWLLSLLLVVLILIDGTWTFLQPQRPGDHIDL